MAVHSRNQIIDTRKRIIMRNEDFRDLFCLRLEGRKLNCGCIVFGLCIEQVSVQLQVLKKGIFLP